MSEPVISVRGLRKSYGEREAVRGIDLTVELGEVFAFLGPNGAGKTTTVEILEGYRTRDAGTVSVFGEDPADGSRSLRGRIGIVLQECRMQPELTVRETVTQYAGFYANPRPVEETIALVGLEDAADRRAGKLSGGQQRRLDVALALVGDAELLFLDEPTTGFDPTARRQAWEVIRNLRTLGKTILLTTHYMDEAQALADRVAVIVAGRIVAEGTPDELGGRDAAATTISFASPGDAAVAAMPAALARARDAGANSGLVVLRSTEPVPVLNELTTWALASGIELSGLTVARPSLEDVYLELTGEQSG